MKNKNIIESKLIPLLGISLLSFVVFFDFTVVNTALPFIQNTFSSSVIHLQWVVNAFVIVLTSMLLPIGQLTYLFGRKKILCIGLSIFILSVLAAGYSPSISYLILFRAFQGIGVAVLFVVPASMISEIFKNHEHGTAVSAYGVATGLALALGPSIGGLLISILSWRWIFWINIPIAIIGGSCCLLSLKRIKTSKNNLDADWKGLSLLIIGLSGIVYGVVTLASVGKLPVITWTSLIVGVLSLVMFFLYEHQSSSSTIDFSIFNKPLFVFVFFNSCIGGIISVVFMFFNSIYLHKIQGLSPIRMGLLLSIVPAMQVVVSSVFSWVVNNIKISYFLVAGLSISFFGFVSHRFLVVDSLSLFIVLPFALIGISWGIANAGSVYSVNRFVTKENVGVALGTIYTIWNTAGAIFLAISSAIFQLNDKLNFVFAYHSVIDFNSVVAILLLLISILMLVRFRHEKC